MLGRNVLLNIPAFPPIAAKLARALAREDASAARAAELLREDSAFTAELVAWANESAPESAEYIEDARHAIAFVGLERLRSLAAEIASRLYMRGTPVYEELTPYWRYAAACASFARELAAAEGFPSSRASLASFLHDLGRIGLTVAHPRRYTAFLSEAGERLAAGEPLDLVARERELFNASRYEAGEWLARAWNFPEEVALAAGRHRWNEDAISPLIRIVRRACRMAYTRGYGVLPYVCRAVPADGPEARQVTA